MTDNTQLKISIYTNPSEKVEATPRGRYVYIYTHKTHSNLFT